MPKQFVMRATRSPASFLAVCFALWLAAHSFFAAMFVSFVALMWAKKAIRDASKAEDEAGDAKAATVAATAQPKAEPTPAASVTPIKRQYAKSAVIVPFKTGTDDLSERT